VLEPITGFRIGLVGEEGEAVDYGRVVSYGVRRCEFDRELLGRSGARFLGGVAAKTFRRVGPDWVVNDAVRARVLVGAGGHFCPVARLLRSVPETRVAVFAQEVEWRLPGGVELAVAGGTPELYFSRDLKGYGWCFRKGDYLNVGLGRIDPESLSSHASAFLSWLKAAGRVPADTPGRWRGHAYLVRPTSPRTPVGEGILLVGDAAGLAYAESGEGIRPAVESGHLAARTILEAGADAPGALRAYGERLRERFGPAGAKGGLLPPSLASALGRALLHTGWFRRHVVLDRWFLRTGLEPLAASA
jgi:flavin-dependent dehydrogenase